MKETVLLQVHVLPKHKKFLQKLAKQDESTWKKKGLDRPGISKHARKAFDLYAKHIEDSSK